MWAFDVTLHDPDPHAGDACTLQRCLAWRALLQHDIHCSSQSCLPPEHEVIMQRLCTSLAHQPWEGELDADSSSTAKIALEPEATY